MPVTACHVPLRHPKRYILPHTGRYWKGPGCTWMDAHGCCPARAAIQASMLRTPTGLQTPDTHQPVFWHGSHPPASKLRTPTNLRFGTVLRNPPTREVALPSTPIPVTSSARDPPCPLHVMSSLMRPRRASTTPSVDVFAALIFAEMAMTIAEIGFRNASNFLHL